MSIRFISTALILFAGLTCFPQGNHAVIAVTPAAEIIFAEPQVPVEGTPVIIYFRFYNNTLSNLILNGWIGAEINSGNSAPEKSFIDWPVHDLANKKSVTGAVKIMAPAAGMQKKIQLFFYEHQQKSADGSFSKSAAEYKIAEKDIDIACLINFRLDNFIINHTRARTTDTDFGALFVSLNGQPAMQPVSVFIGDVRNGTHPLTGKDVNGKPAILASAPISIIPGRTANLYVAYSIYNGGGITNPKKFMPGYAQALTTPQLFNGASAGHTNWEKAFKAILPFLALEGGCDGLVSLDNITRDISTTFLASMQGTTTIKKDFNSEEYASQTGCGNTSSYSVLSSINRLSGSGLHAMGPQMNPAATINTGLAAGGKLNIGNNISWQSIETLDANGNFVQVNDPAFGYISNNFYQAPPQADKPVLVVLRGLYKPSQADENNFTDAQQHAATYIIQVAKPFIRTNVLTPHLQG